MNRSTPVSNDTTQPRFGSLIMNFGKWKVTSLGLVAIMEEGKTPHFIKKNRLWDFLKDGNGERYFAHPMQVIEDEELTVEEFYEFWAAFTYALELHAEYASTIADSISVCLSLQMALQSVCVMTQIRSIEEK